MIVCDPQNRINHNFSTICILPKYYYNPDFDDPKVNACDPKVGGRDPPVEKHWSKSMKIQN